MKRQITKVYTLSYAKELNIDHNEEYYERARYELEQLEAKYPQYIQSNSPTYIIGHVMIDRNTINHDVPMLSIKHTYDCTEGQKWLDNLINNQYQMVLSAKMDGIGISLCYEEGYLVYGALRGDGSTGEDITNFLLLNSTIPMKISIKAKIIIRGELCLPSGSDRAKLSGIIRKKIPEKLDNMIFFAYEYYGYSNYALGLEKLKQYFNIVPYIILNNTIDLTNRMNLTNILKETFDNRLANPWDFDQDGWVIRINKWNQAQELGFSGRYPKYAFALKITRSYKTTAISGITWHVNRTGKLTPVCSVNPIQLEQIILTKVNGFNKRYLEYNQIGIESVISVGRVGQSAPQIINIIKSTNFHPITHCPSCNHHLKSNEVDYICCNINCPDQISKKIAFFFSKLGIKGLQIKTINLLKLTSIRQAVDLFMKQSRLYHLNHQKIQQQCKLLKPSLVDFLSALSIPNLSAITLFKTLNNPNKYIKNINIIKQFLSNYPEDIAYLATTVNMQHLDQLKQLIN